MCHIIYERAIWVVRQHHLLTQFSLQDKKKGRGKGANVPRAALGDDKSGQARARAELEHVQPVIERRGALEVARQCARGVPPSWAQSSEFLKEQEAQHAYAQVVAPERVVPYEPHGDRAPWGWSVRRCSGGADDASFVDRDRRFGRWWAGGFLLCEMSDGSVYLGIGL